MSPRPLEGRVLRGMRGIIERSPRLRMVMEFNAWMMKEAGVPATGVAAMLQGFGFSAWAIGAEGALSPIGWNALAAKSQGLANIVVARERPY